MADSPPKARAASTFTQKTFRDDEVRAGLAMFERLLSGGDAVTIARSPAGRRLHRKLLEMQSNLSARRGKA